MADEEKKGLTKEERKAAVAARKDARKEKKAGGSATPGSSAADLASLSLDGPTHANDKNMIHRTVTGVLTSRPTSRDIKIDCFSMGLNGAQLIQDCSIELTIGRRRARRGGAVLRAAWAPRAPPHARWV